MADIAGPAVGAAVALGGVVLGLIVSGQRAERQRRRDLHARALVAILAYGEMPYAIRRRRFEPEHASAERVRLAEQFSSVKAEVCACQVLLAAEGRQGLAAGFTELVEIARATAGSAAHDAWRTDSVSSDAEMNMAELHNRLKPFRDRLRLFELDLASATLPLHLRIWRWLNGVDIQTRHRREKVHPHDLPHDS